MFFASYEIQPNLYVTIEASESGLREVIFHHKEEFRRESLDLIQNASRCDSYYEQLKQYFEGKRETFDVPLDLSGYTNFQRAVWKTTAGIPYGKTRSYGWIAQRMGNPKASRAVGNALGRNPIPIIIPCHRVIRKNGDLGGFGMGTDFKQMLLSLEQGNR